jgi:hypothetical protein
MLAPFSYTLSSLRLCRQLLIANGAVILLAVVLDELRKRYLTRA